MHRVVIEVSGGVAEVTHNDGALVELFDWDDIAEYTTEDEREKIAGLIAQGKTITAGDLRRSLLRREDG